MRRKRNVMTAVLAAGLLVVATAVLAATAHAATLFGDNFEDGNASGWSTSGGSWSVSTDGSRVYRQSGTGSDAKAQAGSSWIDQSVRARVKPTAFNGSGRFAGVLARAQNMTTYYYLGLTNSGEVVLGRRAGGYTTLASAPAGVSTGVWYTLRLEVLGSHLRGYVDNQLVVSASDSSLGSGRAGLATYYASASFDDVLVSDVAGPSPTTSPPASPSAPPPPPPPAAGQPDGYASVNALGQNGTTGGAGGPTVVVDTTDELLEAIDTIGPLNIHVSGTINITSKQGVRPHKTILGLGGNATINGGGFNFYRSYNVIVRNLTFTNAEDDAINVGQESHHIWIDHNTFVTPTDGSIDVVRQADYVTVSWNWFRGTDKSMLLGHSDSASTDAGHLKVTIHHNYFDGSRQRHPRVRFGEPVHVYNNYFRGNELYAVASTMNAGVLVDGNYFEHVTFPCFSASGYAESGPGRLVQRDNVFVGSGVCETNGSVASPGAYYSYRMDPPADLPRTVPAGAGAGRM